MQWKKGRGKLGVLAPLLGSWQAEADSPQGKLICRREFSKTLEGKYVQLRAFWDIKDKLYEELAMIGVNVDKQVAFWSFTSDGKQSQGLLADVTDIHPLAVGFEAQMPSGLARMAYWPADEEGFKWVVESKTKKGWKRFVEHFYLTV